MNAVATTIVGRTNGTSTRASTSERPLNENRASAQASGSPARSVRTVETVACQNVNHAISRVDDAVRTSNGRSSDPSATRLRRRIATSGQAKNRARKASGTAAVAARAARCRGQRTTMSVHAASHRSRFASISLAGRASGSFGTSACFTNASGSETPCAHGVDEHRAGDVRLEPAGEHEVDQLLRALLVPCPVQHAGVLDLPVAPVLDRRGRCRRRAASRRRSPRPRGSRRTRRRWAACPGCRPRRRTAAYRPLPTRRRRGRRSRGGRASTPASGRRTSRPSRAGTPGPARTSRDSRRRAGCGTASGRGRRGSGGGGIRCDANQARS